MKILKITLFFCIICFLFTGCATADSTEAQDNTEITTEEVASEPNALARQGLAFSRIICSPLNMVGFTVAECENIGGASVILFPIICCWTIPAGAIAMTGDVITGLFEMLFWQQFKNVTYPWDSFDYEIARPYCNFTKTLLIVGLAGAAEGATQGAIDGISGGSSSYTPTQNYSGSQKSRYRPKVRHSSCGGTGKCNICKGRGSVGGKTCVCGGSGLCRPCGGSGYAN